MQRIRKGNMEIRSRKMCSVPQCSTYGNSIISLHKFPLDPKAVKKWKMILKIGKPISKYMFVCSKHFVNDDFFSVTSSTQRKRLKIGSLPSQNLPMTNNYQQSRIKKDRSDRNWLRRKSNGSEIPLNQQAVQNDEVEVEFLRENDENYNSEFHANEHDYAININEASTSNSKTFYHPALTNVFSEDKSTQTDFCDFFELPQILNTDEKLCHFTGVSNKNIEVYTSCTEQLAIHNNVSEKNMKLWLILVLCKLKTNLSFACLAVLFGISNSTCSRMFYSILSLLAISIKPGIYWPTKEEILRNMPKCFSTFKNTRVVLDCTEVRVQRLKCLNCRILSYSHYKKMHTMKFLLGTTPSGLISFISPAYGGRASDKSIFNNENLIMKLDPHDAIMADKGVLIEEECQSHFVKLIQPPFLRKKKQLSQEQSTSTAEIARARVHVERAIQRIKNFGILNSEIDWYLIPYIDDIMTVIAVTVNMSRPILADARF